MTARKEKECLIFVRGKWEIARPEENTATGKPQWIRRDTSFICRVGGEIARMPMPAKPSRP